MASIVYTMRCMTDDRRTLVDRRQRPTPMLSRYSFTGRRQANEIDAAACLDPDVNHPAFRRHAWEVDHLYDLTFQRPQVDGPIGRATIPRLGTGL